MSEDANVTAEAAEQPERYAKEVFETPVDIEVRDSFLSYALSVITARAIPDVRDGLKPVQRRILYAMHTQGIRPGTPYKKSARVVGECFVAGTLVRTATGLKAVEDVEIGDILVDGAGRQTPVDALFYNDPQPLLTVEFPTGQELTVTRRQLFRTLNPETFGFEWTAAEELTPEHLVLAPGLNSCTAATIDDTKPEAQRAYALGILTAEGFKCGIRTDSERSDFGAAMSDIEPLHKLEAAFSEAGAPIKWGTRKREGLKELYEIRSNDSFFYQACGPYSRHRRVPKWVMQDSRRYAPYLAGYHEGDGSLRLVSNHLEARYTSTSKELLLDIQNMCGWFGIHTVIRPLRASTSREGRNQAWQLRAGGLDANHLCRLILPHLATPSKRADMKELLCTEQRCQNARHRSLPMDPIKTELAKYSNGGWWRRSDGTTFRRQDLGLTKTKTDVYRSSKTLCGFDMVKESGWLRILEEVDSPMAANLKEIISGYRVLSGAVVRESGRTEKTYDFRVTSESHECVFEGVVASQCMGKYHPHGDLAIYEALVRMAQDFSLRVPLVDGHGNFGTHDDPPAASRYCVTGETRVRLADGRSVRIEELVGLPEAGERDLDVTVLDWQGRPVRASRGFHSGVHPTRTMVTTTGRTLAGSDNHLVLCLVPVAGVPMFQWLRLDELEPGTVVCVATNAEPVTDGNNTATCEERGGTDADWDGMVPDHVWQGTGASKRSFAQEWVNRARVDDNLAAGASDVVVCQATDSRTVRDMQELLAEIGVAAATSQAAGGYLLTFDVSSLPHLVGQGATPDVDEHTVVPVPYVAEFVFSELLARGADRRQATLAAPTAAWVPGWRADRDRVCELVGDPEVLAIIAPILDSGYHFEEVAAVDVTAPAAVYSLRVDSDDHSFLAGGFVNHNTECRMEEAAVEMVGELSEQTVDMHPNYDGTEIEPEVLPARLPNLLVNGSAGIAVGMATNIAPHNVSEVVTAAVHLLEHPDATIDDLMQYVPGPDFPTGGVILDTGGVREAYESGRGAFRIRAKAEVVDVTAKKRGIVITELPYNVGAERFIARCKQLIGAKQLEGVADIKDLSDRKRGLHIVVECRTGVNPQALLSELFVKTPLEEGFSVNAVALVGGKPETLGLKPMLRHYLDHRLDVVVRRTRYRLTKAEERAHIVAALVAALAKIEEVVAIIRKAKDTEDARAKLTKLLLIDDGQATHILDMPLRRLTGLEVRKLKDEQKELAATIKDLTDILARPERQRRLVGDELTVAAKDFADPRRTRIMRLDPAELAAAVSVGTDLEIPDEPCLVRLSTSGMIGRFAPDIKVKKPGRHDLLMCEVATSVRSTVRVVTSDGLSHPVDVVELIMCDAKQPGAPVSEVVDVPRQGRAVAVVDGTRDVLVVTAQGVVKRVAADQLTGKKGGPIITLKDEKDEVVAVVPVTDDSEVVLVTSDAQLLRMTVANIRPQGAKAGGVAGMRVADGARVLTAGVAGAGVQVVTVTDRQNVKWTPADEFPVKGRATGGVRCMRLKAGETQLVAAVVTDRTVLTGDGKTAKPLTVAAGRRDGAGEPVDGAVTVLGWQ